MQGALEKVAGVEGVEVDFTKKCVTVNGEVDEAKLIAALEGAGFGASVEK